MSENQVHGGYSESDRAYTPEQLIALQKAITFETDDIVSQERSTHTFRVTRAWKNGTFWATHTELDHIKVRVKGHENGDWIIIEKNGH